MAMFSAEVGIERILAIPARPGWGPLALPRCGGSVEAELQAAIGWVREGARASPSTVHTAAGRCGAGKASVGIAQALSSQGPNRAAGLGHRMGHAGAVHVLVREGSQAARSPA